MKNKITSAVAIMLMVPFSFVLSQRKFNPPPMTLDVGNFKVMMNKLMGDGGLQSQFSWNLAGDSPEKTTTFFWPRDEYQSNMLYQIFNPLSLDDNGIKDQDGKTQSMIINGETLTNPGKTDWGLETRRYRPPHLTVDGVSLDAPYLWKVDPKLKSDIKIEFEDVLGQFGIRSHVEIYGFSNQTDANYFIWKATHKFTGELKVPRDAMNSKDTIPDQTINFWWPIAFSFGPSKAGAKAVTGSWGFEGEDDLDSWMKVKSQHSNVSRDSLYIGYYYDSKNKGTIASYQNGSTDDMGDPDRINGYLYSTQIPGYTLLYADKSYAEKVDDKSQPYSIPHAGIDADLWGRRGSSLKATYKGDDGRGRWPLAAAEPEKGPMRFITVGPYSLTKDSKIGRYDSVTFVYAVGAGGIGWKMADSIGRMWFNKQISDQEKDDWILKGKDSLAVTLDRANWAWNRLSKGLYVPAAPPSPDMVVTSGPNIITVNWSYPDQSYFNDAETGVDDWYAWRVYRKRGALYVNDPLDQKSRSRWELVYETKDRNVTSFIDSSVQRGVDYYYAVTAVDNGTQNGYDYIPNQKLESSRFVTSSFVPAVAFKPGLEESDKVRVVPNPATRAAGSVLSAGTPDKISFFNLPYKCTLRIFTETGDLVKVIEHNGTADEEWNQRTDGNQYVSSGIYILAITDAQGQFGKSLDNQFVKFIIVR
ncbi:MAG: hypothetical protein Q8933_04610 [Bacteroidota bacterium]|nr:hypothetical protein [Bacteroidota bacterium]